MKRKVIGAVTSVVLIMCVALAARVAYAWTQVREMPGNLVGLVPFANETGNIAFSMAKGHGFASPFLQETGPTAWLTPVYPAIVAGVFKIFGIRTAHAFFAVLALNILFSVCACVPIFWIGRRVGEVATGAVAAWMWALLPTAIIIPYQWVWDTSLSALLMALITAATLSPAATWGIFDWCGYGLLWGFALMTNPSLAAALPFLFLWAAVRSNRADGGVVDDRVVRWKQAAMALGIAVLCCVPWTVRNYRAFHVWVPLRTTLPLQLWLGNNNLYDPNYSGPVLANAAREDMRQYARMGEIAFMRAKGIEAREFIAGHRGLYAELTWRRVVAFWTGLEHPWSGFWETESWAVRVVVAANFFTFVGMVAGIFVLMRRRVVEWWVLGAWVGMYPVVFYFTRTLLRYRNVIEPVVVVLAAVAVVGIFAGRWGRRERARHGEEELHADKSVYPTA
jgi:hypothetical protein